ncbi:phage tail protein [Tropicibacter sp. R15_0]|uniref:phage tail protein n=1 Tax=Tropicibacter sp. R15_0 TaxID=2821101 RepID=UPI001AD96910|nr:tail fiber protein [Tropicibacter sp. R15_0]MBO9467967.1 phage tail protein [Tropicibacter sp. R15_0]
MADPFLAQIMMFGGNFAPRGWAFCDGQLLAISQYSALFSLLGTTYGGDGRTTFGLPDLRGRVAIHPGRGAGLSTYVWGERGGVQDTYLTVQNLPAHNHVAALRAETRPGNLDDPTGNMFGKNAGQYRAPSPRDDVNMSSDAIAVGNTGGNIPFSNVQPFLGVYHIIALQGIFPSRS